MKKLKLRALEISAGGMLTREQLRNVMGKGSIGANFIADSNGHSPICGSDCCVNNKCAPCPAGSGNGPDCRQTGCPSGWFCGGFAGGYACYAYCLYHFCWWNKNGKGDRKSTHLNSSHSNIS